MKLSFHLLRYSLFVEMIASTSKCVRVCFYIIDFWYRTFTPIVFHACTMHKGGNLISIFHLDYFNFLLNSCLETIFPIPSFSSHSECLKLFAFQFRARLFSICIFHENLKYFLPFFVHTIHGVYYTLRTHAPKAF